jgi:hypothetical protein
MSNFADSCYGYFGGAFDRFSMMSILWVPRTSSTSRDQAIFIDESADPICPLQS